jgi:hypothetical protein
MSNDSPIEILNTSLSASFKNTDSKTYLSKLSNAFQEAMQYNLKDVRLKETKSENKSSDFFHEQDGKYEGQQGGKQSNKALSKEVSEQTNPNKASQQESDQRSVSQKAPGETFEEMSENALIKEVDGQHIINQSDLKKGLENNVIQGDIASQEFINSDEEHDIGSLDWGHQDPSELITKKHLRDSVITQQTNQDLPTHTNLINTLDADYSKKTTLENNFQMSSDAVSEIELLDLSDDDLMLIDNPGQLISNAVPQAASIVNSNFEEGISAAGGRGAFLNKNLNLEDDSSINVSDASYQLDNKDDSSLDRSSSTVATYEESLELQSLEDLPQKLPAKKDGFDAIGNLSMPEVFGKNSTDDVAFKFSNYSDDQDLLSFQDSSLILSDSKNNLDVPVDSFNDTDQIFSFNDQVIRFNPADKVIEFSSVDLKVIDQISMTAAYMKKTNQSQITLKLHPEKMGRVDVRIVFAADQKTIQRISISAENLNTLADLRANSDALRASLTTVTNTKDTELNFDLRRNFNDNHNTFSQGQNTDSQDGYRQEQGSENTKANFSKVSSYDAGQADSENISIINIKV